MKNFNQNKTAFTLLELVFVIVVLGILVALAIPRLDRDLRQEAADAILSDIRYTQHLAITDFKHNANPAWQKSFWRIGFNICAGNDWYEYVGSDMNYLGGPIANNEAARDPANGLRMTWNNGACPNGKGVDTQTSDRIFISYKYGIIGVVGTANCNAQYVGFDHLGRPHTNYAGVGAIGVGANENYDGYLNGECRLTFTMSDNDTFTISIQEETGYAQIVGQDNS